MNAPNGTTHLRGPRRRVQVLCGGAAGIALVLALAAPAGALPGVALSLPAVRIEVPPVELGPAGSALASAPKVSTPRVDVEVAASSDGGGPTLPPVTLHEPAAPRSGLQPVTPRAIEESAPVAASTVAVGRSPVPAPVAAARIAGQSGYSEDRSPRAIPHLAAPVRRHAISPVAHGGTPGDDRTSAGAAIPGVTRLTAQAGAGAEKTIGGLGGAVEDLGPLTSAGGVLGGGVLRTTGELLGKELLGEDHVLATAEELLGGSGGAGVLGRSASGLLETLDGLVGAAGGALEAGRVRLEEKGGRLTALPAGRLQPAESARGGVPTGRQRSGAAALDGSPPAQPARLAGAGAAGVLSARDASALDSNASPDSLLRVPVTGSLATASASFPIGSGRLAAGGGAVAVAAGGASTSSPAPYGPFAPATGGTSAAAASAAVGAAGLAAALILLLSVLPPGLMRRLGLLPGLRLSDPFQLLLHRPG